MRSLSRQLQTVFLLSLALLLSACATTPQPTVALDTNVFSNPELKVGVAYIPPEKQATTHIRGADCLLCIGVASALTSSLSEHLKTSITTGELDTLKDLVVNEYSKRSPNTKLVELPGSIGDLPSFPDQVGFAKKDFRGLKEKLDLDVLVVFKVDAHGAHRNFSSYIPTGDPQGYVGANLYSVNLDNNAYVQYLEIEEKVQPEGEWDEPPTFPNVTTSYFQAVENTRQTISNAL